jgi:hypothetical protein
LESVEQYTYLGVTFNCKRNFTPNFNTLRKATGRALGKIISKIHSLKDFGFKSYEELYCSCVIPILDYASGMRGCKKYLASDNIQNRAMIYFLGVHRITQLLAIYGDMGCIQFSSDVGITWSGIGRDLHYSTMTG